MDERRAVVASQPGVADAASALPADASAVDRVVAGVFAACALSPGVLFGPVQLLLGGGALGVLAIDGRARQPGAGANRPRGFVDGETVPDAGWVAAPALHAALAATNALARTLTLSKTLGPALDIAKGLSEPRTKVLKAIARAGALAFKEPDVASLLPLIFGKLEGGLLTMEDLSSPKVEATPITGARVPWLPANETDTQRRDETRLHVVAAGDAKGRFAVACYEDAQGGIEVAELGLIVPRLAEPVRRGQTRVPVGTPRPAAAPIAVARNGDVVWSAFGVAGVLTADLGATLDDEVRAAAKEQDAWSPTTPVVGVRRSRGGAIAIR